jgi:hypothetical protein
MYNPIDQYIDLLLQNKRPTEVTAGVSGFWVRMLHRLLAEHGYLSQDYLDAETKVPSDYDVILQKAIEMFQRKCGMTPDGICGPQTWAWLACADFNSPGERALVAARREFFDGAREIGGNNKGRYVKEYLRGTKYDSVAWCVAFATWCICTANKRSLTHEAFKHERLSSSRLVKGANDSGNFMYSSMDARPGDIVVIAGGKTGWKHTTLLQKIKGVYAYVIEGNVRGGDTIDPRYRIPGTRDAVRHGKYPLSQVAFITTD